MTRIWPRHCQFVLLLGSLFLSSGCGDQAALRAEAEHKKQSADRLRTIGIALHSYHLDCNRFPANTPNADPKLSKNWRTEIFYKLADDAGQSSETMPLTLATPGRTAQPNHTHYRAFTGQGTVFPAPINGRNPVTLNILSGGANDGAGNTLMIVEASEPVHWQTGDELAYDPNKPLPKLGVYKGGFHGLFADGTVRFIPETIDEEVLRALITWNDGKQVDLDTFRFK